MSSNAPTVVDAAADRAPEAKRRAAARGSNFNGATHGLRGLASLAVFIAHLLGGTAEHIYADRPGYVSLVFAPWSFGAWGVDLFFAISGFVILPSIRRYSLGEFALRRLLRLYPLFFSLSVVFIALNALTNEYPHLNNVKTIISGLFFVNLLTHTEQLTPNAWSLTYEVMFYTLSALLYQYVFRKWDSILATAAVILSCLFIWRYPIALFFVGGAFVRLLCDQKIRPSQKVGRIAEVVFALGCVGLAGSSRIGFSQQEMLNPVAWLLIASTIGYFYCAVQEASITTLISKNKIIIYLGTVSYSLYLVHPYTYYLTRTAFVSLGLFTEEIFLSMTLFFCVTIPLTIALTHVAHDWLEVRAYQWFFNQRIYRRAKKSGPAHSDYQSE